MKKGKCFQDDWILNLGTLSERRLFSEDAQAARDGGIIKYRNTYDRGCILNKGKRLGNFE